MNNFSEVTLRWFYWVENIYQFNKDFIENQNEDCDKA